jgi:ATP-binding cassette subfamily B protein
MNSKFFLIRFSKQYKEFKKFLVFIVFASIIRAATPIATSFILRYVNKEVVLNNGNDQTPIYIFLVSIVAVLIIDIVLEFLINYFGNMMGRKIENAMRKKLFNHVLNIPMSYFDKNATGSLVNRSFSDIREMVMFSYSFIVKISSIIFTLIPGLVLIFVFSNWVIFIVIIAVNAISLVITYFLEKATNKKNSLFWDYRSKMVGSMFGALDAVSETKSYTNEEYQAKIFKDSMKKLSSLHKDVSLKTGFMQSAISTGANILSFLIQFIGLYFLFLQPSNSLSITPLQFYTVLIFAFFIVGPFNSIVDIIEMYENGSTAYKKYEQIISVKAEENNGKVLLKRSDTIKSIKFQNVYFKYSDDSKDYIIENFSFTFESAKFYGIIGRTGCGKSTILKLVTRLYPVTSGKILVNDIPIEEYDINSLRQSITYIQQNSYIFETTIRENIKIGSITGNVPDEIINDAVEKAQVSVFSDNLPEKINTNVGPSGSNLSGGQKQRIAIARSIIRDSNVNLLDEATSSLDNLTEKKIMKNLIGNKKNNKINIAVAHRVTSIKDCDEIVYLGEKGKIIANGEFKQLVSSNEEFKKIVQKEIIN